MSDFLRLPFECAGQDILKEAQADLVLLTFFQVEVKVLYDTALVTALTPMLFHDLKQARVERSWVVRSGAYLDFLKSCIISEYQKHFCVRK